MARLIPTGAWIDGHALSFPEAESGTTPQAECTCGWTLEVTSHDRPWSVIEVRARFDEHLAGRGAQAHAAPTVREDEDGEA